MIKSYELKKRKGSIAFYLIIFFFIGGYGFFLSSTAWMPTNIDATLKTALNENVQWNDRTFKIIRWDYCESSQTMEVELDVSNSTYDGNNSYQYGAADRKGNKLSVETIIEEPDWIIVQIKGVSSDFGEMSFRVGMLGEETDFEALRLYTNVHDVNRVSEIITKDRIGYKIGRFELQINKYQKSIEKNESKILDISLHNQQMQEEITRIQSDQAYQTNEQKSKNQNKIKEIENNIQSNLEDITSLQNDNAELQERIELLRQQITQIAGTKE